jgi:AraC family transcriptional regulator
MRCEKMAADYADCMNRLCDYIDIHCQQDLSLALLSRIAGFSKYHFHRQFTAYAGLSVHRYIQRVRLKRASYQLVFHPEISITEIALEAQFENSESFSRAFKKMFGQTPSQFREKPDWPAWQEKYRLITRTGDLSVEVKIVFFETVKVAVYEHRGAPERLNDSIRQFIEWRKSSRLSPVKTSNTYGIAYDDPKTMEPECFRWDICGEVQRDVPENPQGVITKEIPGGRCACVRHLGSRERLEEKVRYLYGEWLPQSGEELRDFPCFFHYLNLFPAVSESELITDIYLPLK